MKRIYRAVLFDLYDTVVLFRPRVPRPADGPAQWGSPMAWMVGALAEELPEVVLDDFVRAIVETTAEIVRDRPPEYLEVPSPERFRRALLRLGVADDGLEGKAERLSQVHMRFLAGATELPAEHLALLQKLEKSLPLGLVSNFDHGPTARQILARHGLTPLFKSIVISDGFGRRKPHPAIFQEALRQLGIGAADAVFVGDNANDDVSGARAAGIDAVWFNPKGLSLPERAAEPVCTIVRLSELEDLLGVALHSAAGS